MTPCEAPADAALRRFVRDTLGCRCPDAVLREIDYRRGAVLASGRILTGRVAVGGRLLIYISEVGDPLGAEPVVEDLLANGRAERERGGYQRFRLVLAANDRVATRALAEPLFARCAAGDDRLHLHVVLPVDLP